MNLSIPEKLEIREMEFTISTNDEEDGGWFSISDKTIGIGTKSLSSNPTYTFMVICHEVSEIIHVLGGTRYDDYSSQDNYKFLMDHKEFENHTALFSSIIKKFLQ